MKIALFGGSFNPPHVAHLMAAVWVLSARDVDEIWFVPTYIHAFGKELADFDMRCRMLELSIEALGPRVKVSRVEQEIGRESRTIDTLQYLLKQRPGDTFSIVIGADILLEADQWKCFDLLKELAPFYVLGRAGVVVEGHELAFELPEVSSTEIRGLLADGEIKLCEDRVARAALDLIVESGLYGYPRGAGR